MKEPWISKRRTLHLPGLTLDRHISEPNELEFRGCNQHLLCLLLSDKNQQKITRIGTEESTQAQQKGDFWICAAETPGVWAWDSTDESLMFVIDPHLLRQTAQDMSNRNVSHIELRNTIGDRDPQIEAIAQLFQTELESESVGGSLYAESLTQVLIIHLLRHYCTHQLPVQTPVQSVPLQQFQSVLDYIHSSLDQPIHLNELATIAGLSQYHFCRLFKQSFGVSPYQYVLQQRMEKAKILLQRGGKHTIAEISQIVGCTDQSRFARHFKKQFGVSPNSLLEKHSPSDLSDR